MINKNHLIDPISEKNCILLRKSKVLQNNLKKLAIEVPIKNNSI